MRWITSQKCLISSFSLQREAKGLTDSLVPPPHLLNPTQAVWLRNTLWHSPWSAAHLAGSSQQAAKGIWKQGNHNSYRFAPKLKSPIVAGSHVIPENLFQHCSALRMQLTLLFSCVRLMKVGLSYSMKSVRQFCSCLLEGYKIIYAYTSVPWGISRTLTTDILALFQKAVVPLKSHYLQRKGGKKTSNETWNFINLSAATLKVKSR